MTNVVQSITPPAEDIAAQVARICASKSFAGSVLTQSLLSHLVTHALAGDEAQLKEKIIGIEIFDRRPNYSPDQDNIVRLETEKLRHRLLAYYKAEGVGDQVRIGLRRGEFVPYFGSLEVPPDHSAPMQQPATLVQEKVPEHLRGGSNAASMQAPEQAAEQASKRKRSILLALLAVVGIMGALAFALRTPTSIEVPFLAHKVPSIAVLPLRNMGQGNSGQSAVGANSAGAETALLDYKVDGFTETLRAALAATGKLRVSSAAASFAFKNKFVNPRMVSRALMVDRLLQGDFRRQGNNIEVELRLFDTETSEQIWTSKQQATYSGISALRLKMLMELMGVLGVPVDSGVKSKLERLEPKVPAAYDDYLAGLQDVQVTDSGLSSGSSLVLPRAAEHFRRAIRQDPAYFAAHFGLAACLSRLSRVSERKPQPILAEALAEWEKVVALEPENAEAQAMLGVHLARHEQDYQRGEAKLREAIRLNPLAATSYAQLAQDILLPQTRWKEAEAAITRAVELDAADPLVIESNAKVLAFQGKTKEAVLEYEKLSSGPRMLLAVARAYLEGGNAKEAQTIVTRLMEIVPSPQVQGLNCYLYAGAGRKAEAQQIASQLFLARKIAYVPPTALAWVQLGLGDKGAALAALQDAIEEKDPELSLLRASKLYDPLRGEERFRKLVAKLEAASAR